MIIDAHLPQDRQATVQEVSSREIKMEKISAVSEWLSYVNQKLATHKTGKFTARDKFDKPVILEWKITDIQSPDLAAFKKSICDLACQALTPIEVQFLKAHPHAVSEELFLKSCAPFFENGLETVDWESVKQQIESTMRQFYLTDLSRFGEAVIRPLLDDVYFLVTVKDESSEQLLGFAMLAITPALPYGHVKLINIALIPELKESGLDQLLISSIFNILPEVKRMFMFVRPTNVSALETYCSWGFTQDLNPVQDPNHKVNLEYLTLLEYKAEQSNLLQKTAQGLVNFEQ